MKKMMWTMIAVAVVLGLACVRTAGAASDTQGCPSTADKGLEMIYKGQLASQWFSQDPKDYAITYDESGKYTIRTELITCDGYNYGWGDLFSLTNDNGSYKWKRLEMVSDGCHKGDLSLTISSVQPDEGDMGAYLIAYNNTTDAGYLDVTNGTTRVFLLSEAVPGKAWESEQEAAQSNVDADGDAIVDWTDNCPGVNNADQKDTDSDGRGDACDPDDDHDGVIDADDNDDGLFNPSQCTISLSPYAKGATKSAFNSSLLVGATRLAESRGSGFFSRLGSDSDSDGVGDAADQCADTPAGTAVDDVGCPVDDVGEKDAAGGVVEAPLDWRTDDDLAGFMSDGDGCSLAASAAPNPLAFLLLAAALLPLIRGRFSK